MTTFRKSEKKSGFDYIVKAVIIGDSFTGKSCIVNRFADNVFDECFITTIGLDFKIRTIEQDNKKIKIQLWDTAGNERFRTLTKAYYRGINGCILVCDLTDRTSFDNLDHWIKDYKHHRENENQLYLNAECLVLIGNKSDLPEENKQVSLSELKSWASKNNINKDMIFETSAKMNINIDEMFSIFTKKMVSNMTQKFKSPHIFGELSHSQNSVDLNSSNQNQFSQCCR
jgi:Ras-related protein Rab-8A